jgi:hypothetical protein
LLTDAEMVKGPTSWKRFKDPFGKWKVEVAEVEHAHA